MREIIFRAWDGKKLSIGKAEYFDDSVNFRFEHFDIDCDKPILEQYTGLKDKNGKMIFEGDVFTSDYFDDTCNFEVVFNNGAFCGKHEKTGIFMLGFNNYDDNGEELGYWREEDYTSHIQVIGNIHDQKEDV